jgi:chromosome segregation ATPase
VDKARTISTDSPFRRGQRALDKKTSGQLTSHRPTAALDLKNMKPPFAASAEQLNLLRQQLILSQVRIMELEDARDELQVKYADRERLLQAAQTLADAKIEESSHLERVRADIQAQFEHMRHMQHVTNDALNATRLEKATLAAQRDTAEQQCGQLHAAVAALNAETARLQESVRRSELALEAAKALTAQHAEQIRQLNADVHRMKASRSWRWTSWFRSLERTFGAVQKR